jgi:hypothetical protein
MNDIHLIKTPIELELFSKNIIYFALLCLLLFFFLIIFLLLFYLRKKRKSKIEDNERKENVCKKVDYCKIARDNLKKIKKHIKRDDFKTFHLEVSKLLRKYLNGVYEENFLEMTATEILKSKKIDSEIGEYLKEFFNISDREKFSIFKKKQEKEIKDFDNKLLNHRKDNAREVYRLILLIIDKKCI